jgi:acyl-CoA reductase-like NAD-dependent aldehyde dehydrogenase
MSEPGGASTSSGFTGSTEVGKLFKTYSSESSMKPVWTECGGRGPSIVFADPLEAQMLGPIAKASQRARV